MFDWDALVETCRKAAGLDPALADDDSVLDGILSLEMVRRFVDAAEAHLLAEAEARGVTDRDHGLSTRSWLARQAGLPAPVASVRVRVAKRLRSTFGDLDDALTDGRVGWDHVRVMDRVSNARNEAAMMGLQAALLDDALGSVFEGWAARVGQVARLVDEDGPGPGDDLSGCRAKLSRTLAGAVKVDAVLTGTAGELLRQAIEARTDELFRRYHRDHQGCPEMVVPGRDVLRAWALVELATGFMPPEPTSDHDNDTNPDDPGDDGANADGTNADGSDFDRSPAPAEPGGSGGRGRAGGLDGRLVLPAGWRPASRRGRVEATFVVLGNNPGQLLTPDGIPLDDQWARALACDLDLHPVVTNSLGVPLDAGRAIRHASTAQRRAIARRDGGCTFPGCPHPIDWCDLHHLKPWHADGPTDLDNLVALCRHHHGVTHRTGWTMTPQPRGWYTWTTPRGHTLWSQRHHRQHPGPGRQQAGPDPPGP